MTDLAARIDFGAVRVDFPILATEANGKPLVYLDNASTTQKPLAVIDALDLFWRAENANIHRGVHFLSQLATRKYEDAREKVRVLLNAKTDREVIFTKGCTESINLVAASLATAEPSSATALREGDAILLSAMEHHSNIVPWQLAAARVGATVKPIPISDRGEIDLDAYAEFLKSGRVKLVGIVHVSNSLGTVNPVKEMIRMAHEVGALVLVDGAQAGPHVSVDVQDLDADFYTLSGHKIYAPTGIGVLYGKLPLLEAMPPYQGGGDMIRTVSFERTTYAELPAKFEAGTPNIAGAIGLGAAIDYLASLSGLPERPAAPSATTGPVLSDRDRHDGDLRLRLETSLGAISMHEHTLTEEATRKLGAIPGLRIAGEARERAGIVSFTLDRAHPHDIGTILDQQGIAIRTGHHCCMPLMKRLGVPATARASFAFYNTLEEVERLAEGVEKVREMFA